MWYLISTLNRYIVRSFLFWFILIFAATALIISLFEVVELTRRTMQHDVAFSLLMQIAFLKLPKLLSDLLPSITFFAALGCFVRLSQTQNFVAIFSFGLSRAQFLMGVSVVVVMLGVGNLLILDPIKSVLLGRMYRLEEKIFHKKTYSIAFTDTGLWFRETNNVGQNIIHAEAMSIADRKFTTVTIFQLSKEGHFEKRIDAREAFLKDNSWNLLHTTVLDSDGQKNFNYYRQPTTISIEQIQHSTAPPETISFLQMPAFIEVLNKSGLSAINYLMLWHKQIAKIGMMLGFVFLAASFCFLSTRHKSFTMIIGLSIAIGFLMHFVEHLSHAYGLAHKIPLLVAAWVPPAITLMSGYWLMVLFDDR